MSWLVRTGGDPLAARPRERRVVPTFAEAADFVHAEHAAGRKNPKHAAQWKNPVSKYAFPILGRMRVDHVEAPRPDILIEARKLSDGSGYVFPGRVACKPLSNMVFLMALRGRDRARDGEVDAR